MSNWKLLIYIFIVRSLRRYYYNIFILFLKKQNLYIHVMVLWSRMWLTNIMIYFILYYTDTEKQGNSKQLFGKHNIAIVSFSAFSLDTLCQSTEHFTLYKLYIKYSDISCFKFSYSANMSSLRTDFYITRDLTRLQVRFLYLKEVMTLPPVSESKTLNTGITRPFCPNASSLSQQNLTKWNGLKV